MDKKNKKNIKVLFIGDIVGKPGRNAVKAVIPELRKSEEIDYIFANGENLSAGKGMTFEKYTEMKEAGIDYFTSGNHIWNNKDIIPYIQKGNVDILRPANYPTETPGTGYVELDDIVLANVQGRVFMKDDLSDPFNTSLNIINKFPDKIIIIDFHAEATSEKMALANYLDGKAAAVLGTHTHVQTADEKILPKGTAYISDVGMTGPNDSILGIKKEIIIEKFLTQLPQSHKVASGDMIFNAVLITFDRERKKALNIERISRYIKN